MIVSALVVTVDAARRAEALVALVGVAHLTVGDLPGPRIPVVLEAASAEEAESITEGLLGAPGVVFVDVVEVHFAEEGATLATA